MELLHSIKVRLSQKKKKYNKKFIFMYLFVPHIRQDNEYTETEKVSTILQYITVYEFFFYFLKNFEISKS